MAGAKDAMRQQKEAIRRQAFARRKQFPEKDAASTAIWDRFLALPEFRAAGMVMLYVHTGSEVRTGPLLQQLLAGPKRIVVPFCDAENLGLFHLEATGELEPGTLGILEPRADLRIEPGKRVEPNRVDLVMVPGVAFDRRGNRLGHGKGYYDRLLARLRSDALKVGVAFECQLFDVIPMCQYDVPVDLVLTEAATYQNPLAVRHRGDEPPA